MNPSARAYEGLPDLKYPFHDRDALVTACGRICMHKKKINISTVCDIGLQNTDKSQMPAWANGGR